MGKKREQGKPSKEGSQVSQRADWPPAGSAPHRHDMWWSSVELIRNSKGDQLVNRWCCRGCDYTEDRRR